MKCFILAKEGVDRRCQISETFERENHQGLVTHWSQKQVGDKLGFSLRADMNISK